MTPGSITTPAVMVCAVSGVSFGLPPTLALSWVDTSPLFAASLQFAGDGPLTPEHGSDTFSKLSTWPVKRSEIDGARNEVEKVPRKPRPEMGRYMSVPLPVSAAPNVLY